jgi:hypothetical protein
MALPLMPKATAVWLIDNTALTFEQIADFCGMHPLEVQGIADGEVAAGIVGIDPVQNGQVTKEDIEKCEKNSEGRLKMTAQATKMVSANKLKGSKYTPVARRQDKPDAIAWIIKNYPQMTDVRIVKLIGTTKHTIATIKERTHWNISNIKPRDPVLLGLCTQVDLEKEVSRLKVTTADTSLTSGGGDAAVNG